MLFINAAVVVFTYEQQYIAHIHIEARVLSVPFVLTALYKQTISW